jgi:sugar lactone lactonase YvrE
MRAWLLAAASALTLWPSAKAPGAGPDEFRVKREAVFEFAQRPAVTRDGDRVTITFETKGLCDVTVAVEDADGRIVRHLACGVLGPDAPEPLQRNSRRQTLVWDSKDDRGRYLETLAGHSVRVSLGLEPQFERTLFWSPRRRLSQRVTLIQPCEQGVLVYDGDVVDHVRLFDHKGEYLRTIYPFPAGRLDRVLGLRMHSFPQDGASLPLKEGFFQATLLTSGPNSGPRHADGMPGRAGSAIAAAAGRIALVAERLNRLGVDGDTAGLPLGGPKTTVSIRPGEREPAIDVPPLSAAMSPDGRYLYLAGYQFKVPTSYLARWYCVPAVMRMEFAGDAEPALFAGGLTLADAGSGAGRFDTPYSVACDAAGRVYVADYMNDRVQVLSAEGKLLKSIPARKPAQVQVHAKTQQIYVFSWAMPDCRTAELAVKPPTLTRLAPFPEAGKLDQFEIPMASYYDTVTTWYGGSHIGRGWGQPAHAFVDPWSDDGGELLIWLSREPMYMRDPWADASLRLLAIRGGRMVQVRDFADDVRSWIVRLEPPVFSRQRLYVNPKDGSVYVAEGRGYCKSFVQLVRIDPRSGAVRLVDLPFSAEDMAFDPDGLAYLRTNNEMARYDPDTWREVPFDYGEQRDKMGYTASGMGLKTAAVRSAMAMPAPATWHQGGLCVSATGQIAVSCYNKTLPPNRADTPQVHHAEGYVPPMYPGRARFGEIHVWDAHGKLVREDAIQGLGILNGIGIDREGSLYVLAARNRSPDGQPYFNNMAGTLMKFPAAGRGRILSSNGAPLPLEETAEPDRPADILNAPHGRGWVEGAAWMYGGVGFGGKNPGVGCACWNCRFALDYFARSFVPEIDHYSVAVLDSAGNLILRVGRYGNVDDGKPPGDGVALFHACFVATDTDRRLLIADAGNGRIVGVRLDYHATQRVPLAEAGADN